MSLATIDALAEQLVQMGFPKARAVQALGKTNNNMDAAVDLLLSDNDDAPPLSATTTPAPGQYSNAFSPAPAVHNAWKCRNGITVHDFFISYRVSSESNVANKLALSLQSSRFVNCLTMYASGASVQLPHAYLDANCLAYGKAWEDGFLKGLANSRIAVLLISNKALESILANSGDDNLLLEWEFAVNLWLQGKIEIIPLYVAESGEGYIKMFTHPRLDQFPDELHNHPRSPHTKTIRQVMETIFSIQSIHHISSDIDSTLDQLAKIFTDVLGRQKQLQQLQQPQQPQQSQQPQQPLQTQPPTPPPTTIAKFDTVPNAMPAAAPRCVVAPFQFFPGEPMEFLDATYEHLTPLGRRVFDSVFNALDATIYPQNTGYLESTKTLAFRTILARGYESIAEKLKTSTDPDVQFAYFSTLGAECTRIPTSYPYHNLGYALTRTGFHRLLVVTLNSVDRNNFLIQLRNVLKHFDLDIPIQISMFPPIRSMKFTTIYIRAVTLQQKMITEREKAQTAPWSK
ncbi:uncharacterized protein BJ171DRAFT_492878 [Polychytrium aggregatum]|uniref:uncharacterized protein n=1 Tax=Polychytrium aggregatum TaxID=110093 RepID=UPI0022FDDFE0|nr:uncharacterized protein BJ171DRAFT_492878 [Polychytrium aggregatum]KAI9207496.1 hypothetical protein BJ171DRAFT_492878 [Polychytrium aggregatum]